MSGRFAGKHVVVSGGATGVGAATCRQFRAEGASVSVFDINAEAGETLAKQLDLDFHRVDVADEVQVVDAMRAVQRSRPRIDVLFNHAGTLIVRGFLDTSAEEWRRILSVNLMSMVHTTRSALPGMIEAGGGVILNMASISGLSVSALESAYCTSKAACIQLTRAIAVEFRDRNIRCNALAPGFIRTPHGLRELAAFDAAGMPFNEGDMQTLQGRMAEPEEIAAAALFLASDDARFINGETLVVDNGAMARL